MIAQIDASGMFCYVHSDRLGSPHAVTDSSGRVVWRGDYGPYGDSSATSSSVGVGFAAGRSISPDILQFGSRYYSTNYGRFISADDAIPSPWEPQSVNQIAYAKNNPLRFKDPSGRQFEDWGWGQSTFSWSVSSYEMSGLNFQFDTFWFEMDRSVFWQQLNEWNESRYQRFARDPKLYFEKGAIAASMNLTPNVRTQDYLAGQMTVPPFAALPPGQSIEENLRSLGAHFNGAPVAIDGSVQAMAQVFFNAGAYARFTWIVAPRQGLIKWAGGGAWDYKAADEVNLSNFLIAQNAGNFNFGAVGAALGFSLETLLKSAGYVNYATNYSNQTYRKGLQEGRFGRVGTKPPYGDDPIDQYWVIRGYMYYQKNAKYLNQFLR
jgi:RHS repeat-associated protein